MWSTAPKLCQGLRNIKGKNAYAQIEKFNKPHEAQFMFWRVKADRVWAVTNVMHHSFRRETTRAGRVKVLV
jgi:hypothetical protein